MSAEPGTWGREASALPPSLTVGAAAPTPLADLTGTGRGAASASEPGAEAGALFDDTSATGASFAAVAPVTVTWSSNGVHPAQVDFYTLTSGSTGGHPTEIGRASCRARGEV